MTKLQELKEFIQCDYRLVSRGSRFSMLLLIVLSSIVFAD